MKGSYTYITSRENLALKVNGAATFSVAETRDLPGPDHRGLPASKEPQPFSQRRREAPRSVAPAAGVGTSKESRPFSRGDTTLESSPLTRWRRFKGAATIQSRRRHDQHDQLVDRLHVLQRSRDHSVAETFVGTYTIGAFDSVRACFNGAATIQSRRQVLLCLCQSAPLRFNGAATIQSRRHGIQDDRRLG